MLQAFFLAVRFGGLLHVIQQGFFILSCLLSPPFLDLSPLNYNLGFSPRFLRVKHPRARILGPAFHSCVADLLFCCILVRLIHFVFKYNVHIASRTCNLRAPTNVESGAGGGSRTLRRNPRFDTIIILQYHTQLDNQSSPAWAHDQG